MRKYSATRRRVYMTGEKINRLEVYERDQWVCQLCGEDVNKELRFPMVWAATLDHIIPLCLGGTHTYDNVQLAHAYCNYAKGAQYRLDESGNLGYNGKV